MRTEQSRIAPNTGRGNCLRNLFPGVPVAFGLSLTRAPSAPFSLCVPLFCNPFSAVLPLLYHADAAASQDVDARNAGHEPSEHEAARSARGGQETLLGSQRVEERQVRIRSARKQENERCAEESVRWRAGHAKLQEI